MTSFDFEFCGFVSYRLGIDGNSIRYLSCRSFRDSSLRAEYRRLCFRFLVLVVFSVALRFRSFGIWGFSIVGFNMPFNRYSRVGSMNRVGSKSYSLVS